MRVDYCAWLIPSVMISSLQHNRKCSEQTSAESISLIKCHKGRNQNSSGCLGYLWLAICISLWMAVNHKSHSFGYCPDYPLQKALSLSHTLLSRNIHLLLYIWNAILIVGKVLLTCKGLTCTPLNIIDNLILLHIKMYYLLLKLHLLY